MKSYRESHVSAEHGRRYDAVHENKVDALIWDAAKPHKDGHTFLILPSGPADEFETASLMIQQSIQEAGAGCCQVP